MAPSKRNVEVGRDSDEGLMARYAEGSGEAFEELFARYEGRAFAYFIGRTGSRERSRDLYQELFLRVHRARHRFDPARPFAPWFFQVARRLVVDDYRRFRRSPEVSIDDRPIAGGSSGSEVLVATHELMEHALSVLSAEERFVVLAAKGEGLAYDELAARLDKSVVAVRKIASRALMRIRDAASEAGLSSVNSR